MNNKIRITFKDPDAIPNAVLDYIRGLDFDDKLDADEIELVKEHRTEVVREQLECLFKWGEYITVDVDLETEEITVVEDAN